MSENAIAELPQLGKLKEALEEAYLEVGGYIGAQRSAFMDTIASFESEKTALREEFESLKAAKEAVETEKQTLLEEYVSLRADKESLETRVLGLQDANSKLVAENKMLDIIASGLDRKLVSPTFLLTPTQDKDPFALVLIDGNSVPIRATDAPKKFYGGLLAATVLVNAMHALQPGCKIFVRVWADLASLATASGDSFTEDDAREFARGFTAFAHCDFVDVGNGTGRAGAKVRGACPLAVVCDAICDTSPSADVAVVLAEECRGRRNADTERAEAFEANVGNLHCKQIFVADAKDGSACFLERYRFGREKEKISLLGPGELEPGREELGEDFGRVRCDEVFA